MKETGKFGPRLCGFGRRVYGEEIHAGVVHYCISTLAVVSEICLELQHPRDEFLRVCRVCRVHLEKVESNRERLISAIGVAMP